MLTTPDRLADAVFVLMVAAGTFTIICAALLIAAQVANVSRSTPWTRLGYLTCALALVWVFIR